MDYMCVAVQYSTGQSFTCFMDRDKPLESSTQKTEDDKGIQIMMKEYMDGYCRMSPYTFKA